MGPRGMVARRDQGIERMGFGTGAKQRLGQQAFDVFFGLARAHLV